MFQMSKYSEVSQTSENHSVVYWTCLVYYRVLRNICVALCIIVLRMLNKRIERELPVNGTRVRAS